MRKRKISRRGYEYDKVVVAKSVITGESLRVRADEHCEEREILRLLLFKLGRGIKVLILMAFDYYIF